MQKKEFEQILRKLEIADDECNWLGPRQVQIPCPVSEWFHDSGTDSRPSCGVKLGDDRDYSKFNCFTCGERGYLWSLIDSIGRLSKNEDLINLGMELVTTDKPRLSYRFEAIAEDVEKWVFSEEATEVVSDKALDRFPKVHGDSLAYSYCIKRNIDPYTIDLFDLRYDSFQERVIFPVRSLPRFIKTKYKRGETLVGAVGRIITEGDPKYYNYFKFKTGEILGGLDKLSDQPRLLLVEGFFDLLNCYEWAKELGFDVLCVFKAEISDEQLEILSDLDRSVYVGFDNDKAGERGWQKLKANEDVFAYGLKRIGVKSNDVGSMNKQEFEDTILETKKY